MTPLKIMLGATLAIASMAVAAQVMTPPTDRSTSTATDGMMDDKMLTLDADKDGKISRKEADAELKKDWSKLDTNRDGFIDATEYGARTASPTRPGLPTP